MMIFCNLNAARMRGEAKRLPHPANPGASCLAVALGVLVFMALPSPADLVYSNPPPSLTGGGVDLGSSVGAESFTLSHAATIRAAVFYTDEYSPWWDGTLNYFLFDSNGAFPASAPLPGGQGSNPVYRKTFLTGGPMTWSIVKYEFDLFTPLALSPGTYWLGIQLDNEFDGIGLTWIRTITPDAQDSATARYGSFEQWLLQDSQLALALSDTPIVVPEPTSLGLLALGAAIVGISQSRAALWSAGFTPLHPSIIRKARILCRNLLW